jgi:hypothetical protein
MPAAIQQIYVVLNPLVEVPLVEFGIGGRIHIPTRGEAEFY